MDAREFLREQFPSQIILKRFEEPFRKKEKFFRCQKTPLKIRDEFSGYYKPFPLKRISSRDSETNRDPRGYTRYFLYGSIYPYI